MHRRIPEERHKQETGVGWKKHIQNPFICSLLIGLNRKLVVFFPVVF